MATTASASFLNRDLGEIIESLGTLDFGSALFRFLSRQLRLADCTVFFFHGDAVPRVLIAEGQDCRAAVTRAVANDYINNYFGRDANLSSLRKELAGKVTAWRCMHRDMIVDPAYRSKFYDEVDIEEKFSLVARASLGTVYVNMYRSHAQGPFNVHELLKIRHISNVCLTSMRKHLLLLPHLWGESHASRLERVFRLLSATSLTPREAEVCAHVILGFSSPAMADILGISESTVGTLRKRAYSRLKISSQNELFSICLRGMN